MRTLPSRKCPKRESNKIPTKILISLLWTKIQIDFDFSTKKKKKRKIETKVDPFTTPITLSSDLKKKTYN